MPPLDAESVDSQSAQGSEDQSGFDESLLRGDDASAALALYLCQRLQTDRSLKRWGKVQDLTTYVSEVQLFLKGAFKGDFPLMIVSPEVFDCQQFDGLVSVLQDAARKPCPDGMDVLVSAMKLVNEEKMEDRRVKRFHERIHEFVAPEVVGANPSSDLQRSASRETTMSEGSSQGDDSDLAEGLGGAHHINIKSLEELRLHPSVIQEAIAVWSAFMEAARSRESAGEMVYGAIFDSAPSLQSLFKTPRAVQALRFMNGLANFVAALNDPPLLKNLVESLGFGHLHLEVTVPRVLIFRNAIIDLFIAELGPRFTPGANEGWTCLLNYVGGAIIFCKEHYSGRVNLLLQSWRMATDYNKKKTSVQEEALTSSMEYGDTQAEISAQLRASAGTAEAEEKEPRQGLFRRMVGRRSSVSSEKFLQQTLEADTANQVKKASGRSGSKDSSPVGNGAASPRSPRSDEGVDQKVARNMMKGQVLPQTFQEMFEMNAGMSGLRSLSWHREVLKSWENVVTNVANSYRLQEECETLTLRISKRVQGGKGEIKLSEFRSCMLAAMRSLLPKVWDTNYEVAWTWMWDNVAQMLQKNLTSPPTWEAELESTLGSFDETTRYNIRRDIYERFFQLCPAGQDYFKQSNTRLHYIMAKVIDMTLEILQDPWQVVEEISKLGLRHVGYGIPTEHIPHFVTASIEVFQKATDNRHSQEAFRWALGLISKILVRTILEGSTIVMKAVNANSCKLIKKALSCAPRNRRSEWVLTVQVGTQQISPLYWSISVGNLEAAQAIITDLLTIRADRERYYYGVDALFNAHEDIVTVLVEQAKTLVPTLFDGLVWRSRHSADGFRRVNYYVKHVLVNSQGGLAGALQSLTSSKDQTLVSHPVICLVSESLWSGVVKRSFIMAKVGFVLSLIAFMLSQSILPKLDIETNRSLRIAILCGRIVNYLFSMTRMIVFHARRSAKAYRENHTFKILGLPVPAYLGGFFLFLNFMLMVLLIAMCIQEPMFWCIGTSGDDWPTGNCAAAQATDRGYTICSMIAMFIHWLLLIDMAVFSNKLSAFVLVVRYVLSEVGRFAFAMCFLLLTFGSGATCLRHDKDEFRNVPTAAGSFLSITVGLYEGDFREYFDTPYLLITIFIFTLVAAVLLINLLIAQLNCSYDFVYADMVGFARLTRCTLIVETLHTCSAVRFARFVSTLKLDHRVEFDSGDVGLSGAIQVKEPASQIPVTKDQIARYGGICSGDMQWPVDASLDEEDRFEKIEKLMESTFAKLAKLDKKVAGGGGSEHADTKLSLSNDRGDSKLSSSKSADVSVSG